MISTKQFTFVFISTFIIFISMQLVYAQTAENEIIENTLETVEKATTEGLSEINESMSNASNSIAISTENAKDSSNNNTSSQAFQQKKNIVTDMDNVTENAIAGAREQIEESVMDPDRTKQSITLKTPLNGQSEFKEYVSEPLGIKLQIPSEWYKLQENNSTNDCFGKIIRCIIFFTNYNFFKLDKTVDYRVGIQKYGLTFMDIKDLAESSYNYHIENSKGFTFISDSNTTIDNNPAWQMEYTIDSLGDDTSKYMSIYTKVNDTSYELMYSSDESNYSKYLPEALNVLNTIEFISSKPPEVKKPSFLD
jgi:hypothetical protein